MERELFLFDNLRMEVFFQRAREHLARIAKKPEETLPDVEERAPKRKDNTIFVHPLLDKEFEDVITPPKSPTRSQLPIAHPIALGTIDALADILNGDPVDIKKLRSVSWGGLTNESRFAAWCLLTSYHTPQHSPRIEITRRKRQEYASFLRVYESANWNVLLAEKSTSVLSSSDTVVSSEEINMMKQIRKDVPRSSGGVAFLQNSRVKLTLERVLFTWALRHPACGYVQGMNDLVLPFFFVTFASRCIASKDPEELARLRSEEAEEQLSFSRFSDAAWMDMESDLYWMCSVLLNGLQENFTYNQSGVHTLVRKLEAIVGASDPTLLSHLNIVGIRFEQFAFRWMNCLLVREFGLRQVLRLFDTYLAEENGNIGKLHVFVCASMLTRWSSKLKDISDFGQAMSFLQNPPTSNYSDRDMDELISEGFLKQQLYENSNSVRVFR